MTEFQLYIEVPNRFRSIIDVRRMRVASSLVVEDVRETSDGIERLLKADGYRVALAHAA